MSSIVNPCSCVPASFETTKVVFACLFILFCFLIYLFLLLLIFDQHMTRIYRTTKWGEVDWVHDSSGLACACTGWHFAVYGTTCLVSGLTGRLGQNKTNERLKWGISCHCFHSFGHHFATFIYLSQNSSLGLAELSHLSICFRFRLFRFCPRFQFLALPNELRPPQLSPCTCHMCIGWAAGLISGSRGG